MRLIISIKHNDRCGIKHMAVEWLSRSQGVVHRSSCFRQQRDDRWPEICSGEKEKERKREREKEKKDWRFRALKKRNGLHKSSA